MSDDKEDMFIEEGLQHSEMRMDYGVDALRIIYNIHNDVWGEEMVNPPFKYYYWNILTKREREIADYKIAGMSNKEIQQKMGIGERTVRRYIFNIKYIYRNRTRQRVYCFWKLPTFNKDRYGNPKVAKN